MKYPSLLIAAILASALASGKLAAQSTAAQGIPPQVTAPPDSKLSSDQITQAEALALAQAAIKACQALGASANVQVADADGHLRVALAGENAKLSGLTSAPQKLATVLAFQASTRDLQVRLKSDPAFATQYGKDPRYRFSPGGLPIYKAGKFVAALAVGGASISDGTSADESCALEALKVLPWAKTGG